MKYFKYLLIAASLALQTHAGFADDQLPSGLGTVNSCSASLVILSGFKTTNKALVATNGHCLLLNLYYGRIMAYPLAGETLINIIDQSFLNQTLIQLHSRLGTIRVQPQKLLFATMTSTDIALFELQETYQDLEIQHQIKPLLIADKKPTHLEKVSLFSGYFQRQFKCAIQSQVDLIEGPFHTTQAIQLTKDCNIYPGVSGSPIVLDKTNEVIGLANTHSSGEGKMCGFNNPCYYQSKYPRFTSPHLNTSFGVPLYNLHTCFNHETKHFDFLSSKCKLLKNKPPKVFYENKLFNESELNRRLVRFEKFAKPLVASKGLSLEIIKDPDWDLHLGSSAVDEKIFSIVVGQNVFQTEKLSADSFDLSLCHELGHLMGHGPRKKNKLNQSGDWATAEGESDYYAGSCLTQLWGQDLPVKFKNEDWNDGIKSCDLYPHYFQVELCRRIEVAALDFYTLLYSQYGRFSPFENTPPSLSKTDTTAVISYELNYPKTLQCRLDSTLAGLFHQERPSCWSPKGTHPNENSHHHN